MTTNLTLTIEKNILEAADKYAQKSGRSVSELVESYLKALAMEAEQNSELSPRIKRMLGAVNLPEDFDYKQELANELTKKYRK